MAHIFLITNTSQTNTILHYLFSPPENLLEIKIMTDAQHIDRVPFIAVNHQCQKFFLSYLNVQKNHFGRDFPSTLNNMINIRPRIFLSFTSLTV